jgi:ElaA protein
MFRSLHFGNVGYWQLLKMEFSLLTFKQLSTGQLYNIYKLRSKVFIVEQNCAYQDVDDKDPEALHYMMFDDLNLAGYCRIFAPGVVYKDCVIGRVVVEPDYRGKELGKQLMLNSIKECEQLFGKTDIVISAQTYLLKFYNQLGFKQEGEGYLEDDIPHIKMRFTLS